MKFDIIDAVNKANEKIGQECAISIHKNDDTYTIQIKVVMKGTSKHVLLPVVYGQQFVFTDYEIKMDEWHLMNNKFHYALDSLKRQIEEGEE